MWPLSIWIWLHHRTINHILQLMLGWANIIRKFALAILWNKDRSIRCSIPLNWRATVCDNVCQVETVFGGRPAFYYGNGLQRIPGMHYGGFVAGICFNMLNLFSSQKRTDNFPESPFSSAVELNLFDIFWGQMTLYKWTVKNSTSSQAMKLEGVDYNNNSMRTEMAQ